MHLHSGTCTFYLITQLAEISIPIHASAATSSTPRAVSTGECHLSPTFPRAGHSTTCQYVLIDGHRSMSVSLCQSNLVSPRLYTLSPSHHQCGRQGLMSWEHISEEQAEVRGLNPFVPIGRTPCYSRLSSTHPCLLQWYPASVPASVPAPDHPGIHTPQN